MQAEIAHTDLARAMQLAGKIVGRRSTLPVLGGTKLETRGGRLELTSTDLEMTSRTVLEPFECGDDDVVVVPTVELAAAVKGRQAKGETVALWHDREAGTLRVGVGAMQTSIRLLDAADYPTFNGDDQGELVTANLELLRTWASRVLPAASDDEARPVLTAVNVERNGPEITATATDSYRLHTYQASERYVVDQPADCSFLLIARALRLAAEIAKVWKLETGALRYREGQASFELDPVTLWARCVEGEFPQHWRQLIPATFDGPTVAIADVGALRPMLEAAVSHGKRNGNGPLRLEDTPAGIVGKMTAQDVSTVELPMPGLKLEAGPTFGPVAYHPRYLRDAILANGEGVMRLQGEGGSLKPAVMDNRNGFRALLMPVRIP
jgi:DNA polymerase-3 subunit beta